MFGFAFAWKSEHDNCHFWKSAFYFSVPIYPLCHLLSICIIMRPSQTILIAPRRIWIFSNAPISSSRTTSLRFSSTSASPKPSQQLRSSTYAVEQDPLTARAPYYTSYLFLHTPHPPTSWPAKLQSISPLMRSATLLMKTKEGITNFLYTPDNQDLSVTLLTSRKSTYMEDIHPESNWYTNPSKEESYPATLYRFDPIVSSIKRTIHIPSLTEDNLEESLLPYLDSLDSASEDAQLPQTFTEVSDAERPETHIYVCTHGGRDCKCGDIGGEFMDGLISEASSLVKDSAELASKIRLGEVAHVGGHK